MKKRVEIKVYTPGGSFIQAMKNADSLQFTKNINQGLGECLIRIFEKFDFSSVALKEGNHVEIYVSDKDTVETTVSHIKIYSGFISMIEPMIDGKEESITIRLLGYYTKLGLDVLKISNRTTVNTNATSGVGSTTEEDTDIADVVKGIVDQYRAETDSPVINYSDESIPDIGLDMRYSFVQKTYLEAIEKCKSVSPYGTFWYLDENGILSFKQTGDTHKIIFGKHTGKVYVKRNIEQIRNVILIRADDISLYKSYQDDDSVAKYGRRIERVTDAGIKTSATADAIAERFLLENKDLIVTFDIEILDNNFSEKDGYDIESIHPGDTVTFFNFNSSISSLLTENMIITSVEYLFDKARITVEPIRSGIVDIQERMKRQIIETTADGTPDTYTS